jgi:ATPase family AAA domain-containing protein 3A/B
MSWLFGIKNAQVAPPPSSSPPPSGAGAGGSSKDGDDKIKQEMMNTESKYRFDSAALERAAKAAKDLERSPNAREILDLSRVQERTKQMEYEKQIKEMETYQEELKAKSAQQLAEERRKLLDEETRHNQEVHLALC